MLEAKIQKVVELSKRVAREVKRKPHWLLFPTGICLMAAALAVPRFISKVPENTAVISKSSPRVFTAKLYRRDNIGGIVYGPEVLVAECSNATGFDIRPNGLTQGQGFRISSGGLQGEEHEKVWTQTYLNANKVNGIYGGTAITRCLVADLKGDQILSNTVVGYRLELSD